MSLPGNQGETAPVLFIEDDLLASTKGLKPITIIIDTAARDTNNPLGSTNLRKGLLMAPVTASGKYKEFDDGNGDGTEVSANVVVLRYPVMDIDEGDKRAAAFFAGCFHSESLLVHDGGTDPTWADVQRIERR